MEFIGENGWPSPLLQDVKFDKIDFSAEHLAEFNVVEEGEVSEAEANPVHQLLKKLYRDCLVMLYNLYKHCRLVHADFSAFNLILKDFKHLYVIDVSQSVEHDHPRSLDFLRSDLKNVQDFFGKRGVLVGEDEHIFNYITSPNVDDTNCDIVLDSILKAAKRFEEFDVSTEVFRQTFIPKTMDEVPHFERDIKKAKRGKELIYTNVLGLKPDLSGPSDQVELSNINLSEALKKKQSEAKSVLSEKEKKKGDDENVESDSVGSETDSSGSDEDEDGTKFKNAHRPKNETPEEKRERKKAVKAEKAAKREHKIKKHIKKRKEKLAHANSKR
jgi:RIO kinase 1